MCEDTKCEWKCKKPTLCPRPKCELVCEKPACAYQKPNATVTRTCCSCTQQNVQATLLQVGEAPAEQPSFLELVHTFKFQEQQGQQPCCACAPGQQ
jgi:hypothetical protein